MKYQIDNLSTTNQLMHYFYELYGEEKIVKLDEGAKIVWEGKAEIIETYQGGEKWNRVLDIQNSQSNKLEKIGMEHFTLIENANQNKKNKN